MFFSVLQIPANI
jgi:cytochrome P450/NADPH-cytochrome P450 reductase